MNNISERNPMNRTNTSTTLLTASFVVSVLAAGATASAAAPKAAGGGDESQAARGAYLVNAGGCHDCHTPLKMGPNGPEPDKTRLLSGHPAALVMPPAPALPPGPWMVVSSATNTAWSGPWGVSFTANLTPDKETGLGTWTARSFIETIRSGRHLGRGRALLPPMPVQVVANYTDADLEAIFAHLQTVPAINNRVPQPLPPAAPLAAAKK